MAMHDVSVSICDPDEESLNYGEMMDISMSVQEEEGDAYSFGVPKIKVLRKFQDWCVIQLSRGTGPRALLQWISENKTKCFDFPDLVSSSDSDVDEGDEYQQEHKRRRTRDINPVLANPHYSAYAHSLVLVAREPSLLNRLVDLKVTVHCLVKGYHKPRCEIKCNNFIEGKERFTRAICLEVAPSNTAGYISLLAACNDHSSVWIAPRQFRRHLKAGGCPVLGNAKEACAFRGESLCISTVRLEFLAVGIETKQSFCIPPAPRLRTILEREERFWRNKRGQETIRVELFGEDIPKPWEYIDEKATFDGLEFRVTPDVMIPRKGSEALVQRAATFYEKQGQNAPRPEILDLGTGCGNLLISLLHRLRHHNAIGVAVDSSRDTLDVADYNIAALGMSQTAKTVRGRFAHLSGLDHGIFNVVLCNPPYHTRGGRKILNAAAVAHEPDRALFVETEDPLVHYKDVLRGLVEGQLVAPGGFLVFEVFRDNAMTVAKLMESMGLEDIQIGTDANKCIRTVEAKFPGVLLRDSWDGLVWQVAEV
jgi:release factor glutamine methyltransferase